LSFYKAYNLDWLKVMCGYTYPFPNGLNEIKTRNNLIKLEVLNVEASPYNEQLKAIEIISKTLKGETIFLDTVFDPWHIARKNLLRDEIV